MIIFYDKKTGDIRGTIGGRINTPEELKMWIGEKSKNDRIIIQWKAAKIAINAQGIRYEKDHKPDHPQKDLLDKFEKKAMSIYDHKIDIKTKRFIKLAK